MSLIERLEASNKNQNVIITAIEELKEPSDIMQFCDEWEKHLSEKGETSYVREHSKEIAPKDISCYVNYLSKEKALLWEETLKLLFGFIPPWRIKKMKKKTKNLIHPRAF